MGSFCSKSQRKPQESVQINTTTETSDNKYQNMSNTNSKKRKLEDDNESEPVKKKQKIDKPKPKLKPKPKQKQISSMTRQEFFKYAKEIIGECDDIKFPIKPKLNSTNSVGWHASHHDIIHINKNKKVAIIISLNATVIGSKKWNDGNDNKNKNENDDNNNDDDDIKQDKNKKNINVKGDIMTKREFLEIAKDLKFKLFDNNIVLKPKKTSKGSVGWGAAGLRIKKELNGIMLTLMTSVNFTVKKSQDWDEGNDKKNDE